MDHPRIKLAEKDVAELKQQYKSISSTKRQLLLSIKLRKLEAEELLNDPAHGAVAAKELEMARIRYNVFRPVRILNERFLNKSPTKKILPYLRNYSIWIASCLKSVHIFSPH
jgi:hypothetical protein